MFCLLEMEKTCTRLSITEPIQMENRIKYTDVTTNIKSSSIFRIRRHGEKSVNALKTLWYSLKRVCCYLSAAILTKATFLQVLTV